MNDVPVELVVAAFQDENGAEQALQELKQAKKERLIKIENAAVIVKDGQGKVHIKETKDMGGGKGAVIGGVVGGAIGLLFPPSIIATAGIGALVGGLAAKMSDGGFKDDRLNQIGDSLTPGSSAIVAVIDHIWVAELEKELAEAGADVLTATISADIASQLEAGHEVSYSALETGDALATSRVATGEDFAEVNSTVVTDESVEAVHAVATDEGVAAEHLIATEDVVAYEAGVATEDDAAYVAAVATDEGVAAIAATTVDDEAAEGEAKELPAESESEDEDADSASS